MTWCDDRPRCLVSWSAAERTVRPRDCQQCGNEVPALDWVYRIGPIPLDANMTAILQRLKDRPVEVGPTEVVCRVCRPPAGVGLFERADGSLFVAAIHG